MIPAYENDGIENDSQQKNKIMKNRFKTGAQLLCLQPLRYCRSSESGSFSLTSFARLAQPPFKNLKKTAFFKAFQRLSKKKLRPYADPLTVTNAN
jgi:hypothetical protein